MTEADSKQFGIEMYRMATVLRGQITEAMLPVYWDEFADVEIGTFRAACREAIRKQDFFPTIHELRGFLPAIPRRSEYYQLEPWVPKEPWPTMRLCLPDWRQPKKEESDMDRAIKARLESLQPNYDEQQTERERAEIRRRAG